MKPQTPRGVAAAAAAGASGTVVSWRTVCIPLFVVTALHVLGAYQFTSGFFLSRYELTARSQCAHPPHFRFPTSEQHDTPPTPLAAGGSGSGSGGGSGSDGCWLESSYDRAILMIVDALRFDFAYFNESAVRHPIGAADAPGAVPFYQNKLVSLHHALRRAPSRARLFHFESDAPTVTMQRIKGLTTGSLPTFIDVKNNFESAAIDEDNWIDQFAANGKRVVFMGDDTWVKLFPTKPAAAHNATAPTATAAAASASGFARSYPFPSFNVKDLHTVDNGCIQNLMPTLRGERYNVHGTGTGSGAGEPLEAASAADIAATHAAAAAEAAAGGSGGSATDWDVAIAHFLGVDHVGHRYSAPNVPAMHSKLTQIDGVIQTLIDFVDTQSAATAKRTVLFVLGDHGMTADGNHGGQTREETDTTLFVYSSTPAFNPTPLPITPPATAAAAATAAADAPVASQHSGIPGREDVAADECARVPQIDFVPTLSLLLGVPIPYANLGAVIPELFLPFDDTATAIPSASALARLQRLQRLCAAYRRNAAQVATYIAHYHTHAQPFPADEYARLTHLYGEAQRMHDALSAANTAATDDAATAADAYHSLALRYAAFLTATSAMCRSKWTMFDLRGMAMGLATLFAAVAVAALWAVVSARRLRAALAPTPSAVVAVDGNARVWKALWVVLSVACVAAYAQGLFTNSFIIHEQRVVVFLSVAVVAGPVLLAAAQQRAAQGAAALSREWCVAAVSGVVLFRVAALEWSQRYLPDLNLYEMWTALTAPPNADTLHPAEAAPDAPHRDGDDDGDADDANDASAQRLVFALIVCSLAVLPVLYLRVVWPLLRWRSTAADADSGDGEATASRPKRRGVDAAFAVVIVATLIGYACAIAYWFVPPPLHSPVGGAGSGGAAAAASADAAESAVRGSADLLLRYRNWLPRAAYVLGGAGVVWTAVALRGRPLAVALAALSSCAGLVWALLLGPKSALSTIALGALVNAVIRAPPSPSSPAGAPAPAASAVELASASHSRGVARRTVDVAVRARPAATTSTADPASTSGAVSVGGGESSGGVSFSEVVALWFVSVAVFFATGKSNEFSRLPITTAFVGFEEYSFFGSGAMLLANTFVGQLSAVLFVLPIIVAARTHARPVNAPAGFFAALTPAYLSFVALYALRTALSAANVTLQRRHLMVWAIFAPKYVYDAASGLVAMAIAVLWPIALSRFAAPQALRERA